MPLRTAVVILNWNTRNFLELFLPDVIKFSSGIADIIVADNASTDDSVSFLQNNFPQVRIIQNEKNDGYTGGYNEALAKVDAEYFVLLNSDVRVTEHWLEPLIELMDKNKEAGACQPKLLAYDSPDTFEYAGAAGGFIDKFGYPFCRGRVFNSLEKDNQQYDDTIRTFWATGACMFVRSSAFKKLNGFDPLFFAHMEEIDLCWRMQLTGYQIFYCPNSVVYHVGGGTLPKSNPRKTYYNFRNNLLLIFKNSHPSKTKSILQIRFFLDALASIKFLLSGGIGDFKAVWSARRDFNKLKTHYEKGASNDFLTTGEAEFMIYPKSIVWDYYICARKKFSSLSWKRTEIKG